MIRLDKWLSQMTGESRADVKNKIKRGLVQVNDNVVCKADYKVDTASDTVLLEGMTVAYEKYQYYMLHKPAGVISATRDPKHQTVLDLLKDAKGKNLAPVGRLDKDTEGLLLITNDGALAHALLAPGKHVDKVYLVEIEGILSPEDIYDLEHGMDIGDDKPTMPAMITPVSEQMQQQVISGRQQVYITIQEGRYHQVKRMFAHVGKPVCYLKRLRMGSLVLDETLPQGKYRPLSKKEIEDLRQLLRKK